MSLPSHDPLPELRARVLRSASSSGQDQPIPRTSFWASTTKLRPTLAVWEPVLYLVLQGTKRLTSGERILEYGEGSFVLGSIHVPILCEVVRASVAAPYIAVGIGLDLSAVSALLLEMRDKGDVPSSTDDEEIHALTVGNATVPMFDALLRLVRLLDAPADIPVLAPAIERELLYRVLQTPYGTALRQLTKTESRLSQIQRAVTWIRENPAQRVRIEALAGVASMSVSAFFRHFKAVTGLSPLAYQKQIRLQEARRRLLVEPGAVARVAFSVGYESASQFSREYARQFGMSPARDAARLRTG